MSHIKLDDYTEMATTLQIFDKEYIYACICIANCHDDVSKLTSLVDILVSKENKKEIMDYLVTQGKKDLQNLTNDIVYKESVGSPRHAIRLNYELINKQTNNDSLNMLINSALARGL